MYFNYEKSFFFDFFDGKTLLYPEEWKRLIILKHYQAIYLLNCGDKISSPEVFKPDKNEFKHEVYLNSY